MDGSKTVVISRDADNEIQGWLESNRPSLIVRCKEHKTEAYIVTGMAANVEYDTDSHSVRLRFDDGNPVTQHWSASTDGKALFAPGAIDLAKKLVGSKSLTFEFTPFNANPAIVHFTLEGLAPYLQKAADACGWRVPTETE
jgi:type VI secretion system VasI family protein